MVRNLVLVVLLVLFSCTHLCFANSQNTIFSRLDSLALQRHISFSAYVLRLEPLQVLAEKNADSRLSPASVSKLVVAADALQTWGPDKTFSTEILLRGRLAPDGVLHGDLVFYGLGDPSLTNEKLWSLSLDVARYGVKKVTGRLIVNTSFFGNIALDPNRLAGQKKSKNAYDSPLSSAAVNFSVVGIVVTPNAQKDKPAKISLEPYSLPSEIVVGSVSTDDKKTPPRLQVSRQTFQEKDLFTVSGSVPEGGTAVRIYRSVSQPDLYAGEVLSAFLQHAGILISSSPAIETTVLRKTDRLIAKADGFSLDWQLRGLFRVSNNFIADMLALQLLRAHFPRGEEVHFSLEQAGHLLELYLLKNQEHLKNDEKKNTFPLVMKSGSGLTSDNRFSAKEIVLLLKEMYFDTEVFPVYLSALPVPGLQGTLLHRFSNDPKSVRFRIRAKTGTLSEPFPVVSLAGYSWQPNLGWIAFAILVNGSKLSSSISLETLRNALDTDLINLFNKGGENGDDR